MAYVRINMYLKECQGTRLFFILAHLYRGHFLGQNSLRV